MKKPLIGSANGRPCDSSEEPCPQIAQRLARRRKTAAAGCISDPGADRQIARALGERFVHLGEDGFVMLKIAVDDRDEVRARRHPPLDDGAGKTRAIDASQAAYAAIFGRERKSDAGGAVRRVVIDDDQLPRRAVERALDALEENRNVGRFPIGRDDDRNCRLRSPGRFIASHSTPRLLRSALTNAIGRLRPDKPQEALASSRRRGSARV